MKLYELNPRYLPKVMLISLGRDDRVLQLLFYSLIRQRTRGFLSSDNLCNSEFCLVKRYSDENLHEEKEYSTPSEYPAYRKNTGNCWV